jgi:hypothetical protein
MIALPATIKNSYTILFYIFHGFFENKSGIIQPARKVMGDVGSERGIKAASLLLTLGRNKNN